MGNNLAYRPLVRKGPLPEGSLWYPLDQLRKNPWGVSLHCEGILPSVQASNLASYCAGFGIEPPEIGHRDRRVLWMLLAVRPVYGATSRVVSLLENIGNGRHETTIYGDSHGAAVTAP